MIIWKKVILKTIGFLFFYSCFSHMCFEPDHIESGYFYYHPIIEEIVNQVILFLKKLLMELFRQF